MSNDELRVIIVDDEHLVRNLLRQCIDWGSMGMVIAGEAASAREALELVDEKMPDIIFTDIYMPFMDGIEFSKIVVEKYPHIKIIVLTGYEEFEYAKRSIKVGVADFLLKPIHDEEIKKVALQMKGKIQKERDHRAEYNKMKQQVEETLPYLKEKFLNELLYNHPEYEESRDKLLYFDIETEGEAFQVTVLEITYSEISKNRSEEERLVLGMQGMNIVKRYFEQDRYVNVFYDNSQNIIVLNNNPAIDMAEGCEVLKTMIINRLKCFICIGIGNWYQGLQNIHISYQEAYDALHYKVIAGKNEIIHYGDINFFSREKRHFQTDLVSTFSFYLKAGLQDKAVALIEVFYNEIDLGQNMAVDSIRVVAVNIISIILNAVAELGVKMTDDFEYNAEPYKHVFKMDTLPDMKDYLKELVTTTIMRINRLHTNKVSSAVKEIQAYLIQNSGNCDLSLSGVARKFYLNPSYLSRIFKQEMGQTFVEYLTKIRMENAIKLLKETDMKAYQIAEKVGIADPHYFSICFKKYAGMSVSDYKNRMQ